MGSIQTSKSLDNAFFPPSLSNWPGLACCWLCCKGSNTALSFKTKKYKDWKRQGNPRNSRNSRNHGSSLFLEFLSISRHVNPLSLRGAQHGAQHGAQRRRLLDLDLERRDSRDSGLSAHIPKSCNKCDRILTNIKKCQDLMSQEIGANLKWRKNCLSISLVGISEYHLNACAEISAKNRTAYVC